jgi:hypothetical protein
MPLESKSAIRLLDIFCTAVSRHLQDAVMVLFDAGHDQVWQRVKVQVNFATKDLQRHLDGLFLLEYLLAHGLFWNLWSRKKLPQVSNMIEVENNLLEAF